MCTTASVGEAMIQGDEQAYFADKAYDSQALRETLERRGMDDGIAWKVKHARKPLEPTGKNGSITPGRRACAQASSAPTPR